MVRVLLFGRLADVAGWRERSMEPAPKTLFDLRDELARLDPDLGRALSAKGVQAAVNRALVRGDSVLAAGAEIAFMSPMSGG